MQKRFARLEVRFDALAGQADVLNCYRCKYLRYSSCTSKLSAAMLAGLAELTADSLRSSSLLVSDKSATPAASCLACYVVHRLLTSLGQLVYMIMAVCYTTV